MPVSVYALLACKESSLDIVMQVHGRDKLLYPVMVSDQLPNFCFFFAPGPARPSSRCSLSSFVDRPEVSSLPNSWMRPFATQRGYELFYVIHHDRLGYKMSPLLETIRSCHRIEVPALSPLSHCASAFKLRHILVASNFDFITLYVAIPPFVFFLAMWFDPAHLNLFALSWD